ncbi:MAG: OsmC family protein [candidate division Zixibacteria bacterium]|nr:OsmC family protein [candidate division Zixibacteria bacterium]
MMTAKMTWTGGIKFEGTGVFGHKIVTDGARDSGGGEAGYKPTELLLFGIASCTGVDVVRILEKQRQQLTSLAIEVTGHQSETYPKPFHTVEVKYILKGDNLDPAKVAKAIELSESKYCVVSQTVQNAGKVITSFEIQ